VSMDPTAQFEQHRDHLRAVAYRMLGSVSEAEDAVQEAWIRLNQSDAAAINNLGGWLTTVVGRVSIDMLRARKARRENYVGTWLPEPVVTNDGDAGGPEQETLLADSVGMALLVVLDTLNPAERLSFVLHDMFGVPFEEIAPMIDRSPQAARQLASRARRRVRGAPTVPDADLPTQRKVVSAFLAAARAGDFEALIDVLNPDVVFRVDSGGRARELPPVLAGAEAVAGQAANGGPRFARFCELAMVNGAIGLVLRGPEQRFGVAAMTVVNGRISEIDLILDPEKLKAAQITS
jgi:RNA polymerase sigma factor (sigma-70 family)